MRADKFEIELVRLDVGEGSFALTHAGRHDPQVVFVDKLVVQQRSIQRSDPVLHDVPAVLALKRGKFLSYIAFEKRSIPGDVAESRRCHELLEPVDPVYTFPVMLGHTGKNVS